MLSREVDISSHGGSCIGFVVPAGKSVEQVHAPQHLWVTQVFSRQQTKPKGRISKQADSFAVTYFGQAILPGPVQQAVGVLH